MLTVTKVLEAANELVVGSKVSDVSNAAPDEVAAEKATETPPAAFAILILTVFGKVTSKFLVLAELARLVTRYVAASAAELSNAKVSVCPADVVDVNVEGKLVSTKQPQANVNVMVSFNAYSALRRAVTAVEPRSAKVT